MKSLEDWDIEAFDKMIAEITEMTLLEQPRLKNQAYRIEMDKMLGHISAELFDLATHVSVSLGVLRASGR